MKGIPPYSGVKGMPPQPMQPIVIDEKGVPRFKANAIVQYLLDHGGIDMNKLARLEFSQEDRMQFAQLIGYSVSGFGDLSYAHPAMVLAADTAADLIEEARRK